MHYRLSLLSTQLAQPLLRSDNLGSSQLLISRYAWTWRETPPCLLINFLRQLIGNFFGQKFLIW